MCRAEGYWTSSLLGRLVKSINGQRKSRLRYVVSPLKMHIVETARTYYIPHINILLVFVVSLTNLMVALDTEESSIPRPIPRTTSPFIIRMLATRTKYSCNAAWRSLSVVRHSLSFFFSSTLLSSACLHHSSLPSSPWPFRILSRRSPISSAGSLHCFVIHI